MSRTIWLVTGSTGEYSDRTNWNVRAFATEDAAVACVARLAAWCDERQCGENPSRAVSHWDLTEKPPDDPFFECDYTGTRYTYEPVELEEP